MTRIGQGHFPALAWDQCSCDIFEANPDRAGRTRMKVQHHTVAAEFDVDRLAAVAHLEGDGAELAGQQWVKAQDIVTGFDSGVASDHHVRGAGHRTQMDTRACCPALDVGEVAVQCLGEQGP